jgi:serine/threonine protein kinase
MQLPTKFGRYTLVEKIARGGTAEIYRSTLSSPGGFSKKVAIKRLLPEFIGVKDSEEMLIDEARVLTHLRHQSIVQVLDLGNCDGIPFIAMEFIDGIDCARLLREVIRDGTPLPLEHALYIIEQVLRALEFAHRCVDEDGKGLGIVHRDISPSNILLSFNGEVKLTDFGIAKGLHRTSLTAVGQLKGKYSYMAPEQARGGSLDGRADIFACGVVLAELLTARRIFDGDSDLEVLEKVRNVCVADGMLDEIPPHVRAIIIVAMAKDIGIRYRNAAWMLDDVRRAASNLEVKSSSLDLSTYIRTMFPMEFRRDRLTKASPPTAENSTRVYGKRSGIRAGLRSFASRGIRVACMVLMVGVLIPISPTRGRAVAKTGGPQKGIESNRETKPLRELAKPKGVVVVDSVPRGAKGRLKIGEASYDIVTPFAADDIDIGDGLVGWITLSMNGYKQYRKTISLSRAIPTFSRKVGMVPLDLGSISVHAKPWGIVTVGDRVKGRETPIEKIRLAAGSYLLKVRYPPMGKTVSKKVVLAAGSSIRCIAQFNERAGLSCR